jgi:hypothetical protein
VASLVEDRYKTTLTKSPIVKRRRFLFGLAATAAVTYYATVEGTLDAVREQQDLDKQIATDDLKTFRRIEDDHESLARTLTNLGNTPSSPFARLLKLQLAILAGDDLRGERAQIEQLSLSQTGEARTILRVMLAKIFHLTGDPWEAAGIVQKEISGDALRTRGDLCALYFQLLASKVAGLAGADIDHANKELIGSVKDLSKTLDNVFAFLFPSPQFSNRLDSNSNLEELERVATHLSNETEQCLALSASLLAGLLAVMRNHKSDKKDLGEARQLIELSAKFGNLAPRHGWNALSVFSGLYWRLGRLDEALLFSDAANLYLENSDGSNETSIYARHQSKSIGTEYIIFATTRARIWFQKAKIDRRNEEQWMKKCRKLSETIRTHNSNLLHLSQINQARQWILADVEGHTREPEKFKRIALCESMSKPAQSHILYGAMPPRQQALDQVRKWCKG